MRTMTALEGRPGVGIYVVPVDGGREFVVRVSDKVFATVSARDFDEMMRRGHAVTEPEIGWTSDSVMGGRSTHNVGGIKILRCGYQLVDGAPVRLVPESEGSPNLLFFHCWSNWMSEGMTCGPADGADVLDKLYGQSWGNNYHLVMLPPGSALLYRKDMTVQIPGKFMRRRAQTKVENRPCGEVRFNADGKTVHF